MSALTGAENSGGVSVCFFFVFFVFSVWFKVDGLISCLFAHL